MRFSEEGLYRLLEKLLREAEGPMNCNELFDIAEVRDYAASPNRVSDYPGNMWRRGLLRRTPETDPGRGPWWRYMWKDKTPPNLGAIDYLPKLLIDRPNLLISEEGDRIQIDLKELVIIQHRKKNAK